LSTLRRYRDFLKSKYGISVWRVICRYWLPHFLLSGSVGALVYWLTLTMLLHTSSAKITGFSMYITCWLLALSCAVVSHILEDYWLNKF